MNPALRIAPALLLGLWAGALLAVGALVAPALFRVLPERTQAGLVAGHLFTLLTWLSVAAGGLLVALRTRVRHAPPRSMLATALAALLPGSLLLGNELGLRPLLDAARDAGGVTPAFMAWHALSAALYAAATLVVLALLVRELCALAGAPPGAARDAAGVSPAVRSG